MSKYGIDISEHNGYIDWSLASKNIEFCFIRGGYGKNNIDKRFHFNAKQCKKYKIPFGIYWFSYALSEVDALNEAEYVCLLADDYAPELPICFDWEYDSDDYAKKKGVKIDNEFRVKIAIAFLERVKARGYKPMLYANPDYIYNKGFIKLINIYNIWLAQWNTIKPSVACLYWQASSQGSVNGISTNVDINISYEEKEKIDFSDIMKYVQEKYYKVATEIVDGKYGAGNKRKNKLKELGYDYELAQSFVNRILGVQ